MIKYINRNKSVIIVLHEIYGINDFIMDICYQYHTEGYDIFCPNLFNRNESFPYSKGDEAYYTFLSTVGFDVYEKVNSLASNLKKEYSKLIIIGFSVGATIAWRCSEQILYDGVICCYGSRIRDYLTATPKCPVLLVFAKHDSFDVKETAIQLHNKENLTIEILAASHGFLDSYSKTYDYLQTQTFNQIRKNFLLNCIK